MELIAGSRIVKAQQRVHAAVPYSEKITEVVKDLAAAGGGETELPLLAGRSEVRTTCYVGDRRRPRPLRRLQRRRPAGRPRARSRPTSLDGKHYLIVPVGRKPEAYFRFRGYTLGESFQGFTDNPAYADAKAIGDYVIELFTQRRGRQGRARLHPLHLGRLPGGRAAAARAADRRDRHRRRRPAGARRRRAGRRLRVRARPEHHPRHAAAALRRGPRLRRPAQRRGVRARLQPAGDEGGHRQRRRADQDAQPDHEPRPPGHHHDRDHGDRQRRRGPRRRRRKTAAVRILDEFEVDAFTGEPR